MAFAAEVASRRVADLDRFEAIAKSWQASLRARSHPLRLDGRGGVTPPEAALFDSDPAACCAQAAELARTLAEAADAVGLGDDAATLSRVAKDSRDLARRGWLEEALRASCRLRTRLTAAASVPKRAGRKPGPTPAPEEERRRYRVVIAWEAYKAAPGRAGKAIVNVDFLDWCDRNGFDVPHPHPAGAPMGQGSDWHRGIQADKNTVATHLRRNQLTLDQYADDLRRRGVI